MDEEEQCEEGKYRRLSALLNGEVSADATLCAVVIYLEEVQINFIGYFCAAPCFCSRLILSFVCLTLFRVFCVITWFVVAVLVVVLGLGSYTFVCVFQVFALCGLWRWGQRDEVELKS